MKKVALDILSQIIPVMLGVYLGFAMNNFGESRKLTAQSNTYKLMLRNEISANLKEIKGVSTYHIQLIERFSKILDGENIVKEFDAFNFNGFRAGFVSSSAYNTGIQTGIIQEFDLGLIQSINRLYTLQGKYTRFNENMINSFLSRKFPETASEIKSLLMSSSMSMNDVIGFEKELTRYYNVLLEEL